MSSPLRILSFESRKAEEMRSLIERHGGQATLAAAMKEIPLGISPELRSFSEALRAKAFDLLIFMTGVGAEALVAALETEISRDEIMGWLRQTRIIVRGPKPAAVLKKWDVPFVARADEPNTWREVIAAVRKHCGEGDRPLAGWQVAVQEYGAPSTELYVELEQLGATVRPVTVYRWSLPDDVEPLKAAIRAAINREFDVVLFTTAQHLVHSVEVAESMGLKAEWLQALSQCVLASIGPTATERLREYDLPVAIEPEHPHMGHLVKAVFENAPSLVAARNK